MQFWIESIRNHQQKDNHNNYLLPKQQITEAQTKIVAHHTATASQQFCCCVSPQSRTTAFFVVIAPSFINFSFDPDFIVFIKSASISSTRDNKQQQQHCPMKSASMTPFKRAPAGQRLFASLNDDDMEAESDSVESPPSNARQRSAMKPNTRSRLFEDDSDDFSLSSVKAEDQRNGRTPVRSGPSKILRPLDLNFSFDDEDADDMAAPVPTLPAMHTSEQHLQQPHHQDRQRRTRRLQKFAESGRRGESQTPTRLYGGLDADNAMASSPYVSPSSYMMTMDGRCVTSNNPFSPMVTEDSNAAAAFPTNGVAPSFPVSFDTNTSDPACPSGALAARHRLQKRDASTWSSPSKRSFLYASFTRDGYPERSGRYSFTGSPIKENEVHNQNHMDISTSSTSPSTMAAATKIRRLGMQEDVHYANNNSHENGRRDLVVDTNAGLASSNSFEEVSPTDVMSFPAPPTPTKTRKSKSPFLSTPNPPETPSISRSGRRPRRRMGGGYGSANSSDMDDISNENYSSGDNAIKLMTGENSRFKSDFDVIGELGKGSFGAVYKVLSRLDGCMYAVKTALRQFKGEADRARMLKEVSFGSAYFLVFLQNPFCFVENGKISLLLCFFHFACTGICFGCTFRPG